MFLVLKNEDGPVYVRLKDITAFNATSVYLRSGLELTLEPGTAEAIVRAINDLAASGWHDCEQASSSWRDKPPQL